MRIILVFLIIISTTYINGQDINYTIFSHCKPNAYIQLLNCRIDSIKSYLDTTNFYITWNDNCSITPKFELKKIKNGMIELKMEDLDDEWAGCNCDHKIKLAIPSITGNYYLKINDSIVKQNLNRYNASNTKEYFYLSEAIKREIYSLNGKIIIECFYDKSGKLVKERFYHEFYGSFNFENEY